MGQASEESMTEFTSNGNRHYTILVIRILENFVPVLKTSQDLRFRSPATPPYVQ